MVTAGLFIIPTPKAQAGMLEMITVLLAQVCGFNTLQITPAPIVPTSVARKEQFPVPEIFREPIENL